MPMPDQVVMTGDEQDELAAKVAGLHAAGYVDIAEHDELRVGVRIRHGGQRYSEAFRLGTGFVVALTEKPDSAWSKSWGKPDIELIALWDKPWPLPDMSRMSQLAQYHVHVIEVTDAVS